MELLASVCLAPDKDPQFGESIELSESLHFTDREPSPGEDADTWWQTELTKQADPALLDIRDSDVEFPRSQEYARQPVLGATSLWTVGRGLRRAWHQSTQE